MDDPGTPPPWLARWGRHPKAILIACIAVLTSCLLAASRTSLEWAPSVSLPAITLSAAWPGASPQGVERYVTAPLERALQGVPGIRKIESYSREGEAVLRLEVAEDRRLSVLVAEVSDRVAALRGVLPERVVPRVAQAVPEAVADAQGFMTLQLVGGIAAADLRSLAEEEVAPRLRSLQGVAAVAVEGGEERELLVSVDTDRLQAHNLTVGAVQEQLREAFSWHSYGWVGGSGGQRLMLRQGEDDVAEISRIALSTGSVVVHLSDVSQVTFGPAPARSISRVDGKSVVALQVDRTSGSNLLAMARDVRRKLEDLRSNLPLGVEILVADDRSKDVKEQLLDLAVRGGLGLLAIIALLLAVLRSGRATAIVLFSVALALGLGLALMRPLGLTLNVLTLAGLGLLVGFLVSSALVVVEELLLERARGGSRTVCAARALHKAGPSLFGGTAALVAVFVPLLYLSGELRSLFTPFAVLSILTLVFSLFGAMLVVPVLGQFLPATALRQERHVRRGDFLLAPFHLASRHPWAVLCLLLLAIGLPTPLFEDREPELPGARFSSRQVIPEGIRNAGRRLAPLVGGVTRPFLKKIEYGEQGTFEGSPRITMWIRLPAGSGIERADERIRVFEELALGSRVVSRTLTRVTDDFASLQILFAEGTLKSDEPLVLREELIALALPLADLEISIAGLSPVSFYSGLGNVSGFSVDAYGPSYERLDEVAETFARRLERDPRVAEVDTSFSRFGGARGREVIRLGWSGEAVARSGVQAGEISGRLRSRLLAHSPLFQVILMGHSRIPVRLVAADAKNQDLSHLLAISLGDGGPKAAPFRLAGLADLSTEREPPVIERENQQYRRRLLVYYRGPYEMGVESIDREIGAMALPPGYRLERPQHSPFAEESKANLVGLILGALVLVFLATATVLESWRLAGLVILSIPLAWIGVALGFVWREIPFGDGAFLGSVLTTGTSVNSAIFLVDQYRRLRRKRVRAASRLLALLTVRLRLRLIWGLTLGSIAGTLPILLLPGARLFWVGLATTVVGGLLSSTLFFPFAMVALLSRQAPSPPRPSPFPSVTFQPPSRTSPSREVL